MCIVMDDFKHWCGLPSVHGVIDGTHIPIFKPFTLVILKIIITIR